MRVKVHWMIIVSIVLGSLLVPGGAGIAQGSSCQVSEHYAESVEENSAVLIKVLAMVNTPGSPTSRSDTAMLYFNMLASTRRHLEGMRSDLPECALVMNQAMMDTISASQDVLTLGLALELDPENSRLADRQEQAKDWLNQTWDRLNQARNETGIGDSF